MALLEAAERIAAAEGIEAVSVRALTEDVGTTTRAIYSLFGSKDGLIAALGVHALDILGATVAALPTTADPSADLVEAGVSGFRQFAVNHPALFALGIQARGTTDEQRAEVEDSAARAWGVLRALVARLDIDERGVDQGATAFHALCEGLAALELRGVLAAPAAEDVWRDALTTLVAGLSAQPPRAANPPIAAGGSGKAQR